MAAERGETSAILLIASLIRLVTVEIPRRHRHLPARELPALTNLGECPETETHCCLARIRWIRKRAEADKKLKRTFEMLMLRYDPILVLGIRPYPGNLGP